MHHWILQHPRLTAVVSGVLVGLLFFLVGRASMHPINIGMAALSGAVWGVGWRLGLSRAVLDRFQPPAP